MDALVELILEIFFEVFVEIIFACIGAFFDHLEWDRRALKITKIVVYTILALGLFTLLTISLIYKKGIISIVVISYLFILGIAYYLKFFFKEVVDRKEAIPFVIWPIRILKYVFAASLIVMACLLLTDPVAKGWLIGGTCVGIFIYICIDIFRIRRHFHNKI